MKKLLAAFRKGFSWIRASDDGVAESRTVRSPKYLGVRTRDIDNNTIIQACVRWASRNFPEPSIAVERITSTGWKPVPDHAGTLLMQKPLSRVANTKNKSSYRLMMAGVMMSLMLDGNAYIQKLRNASGKIIGLRYLSHLNVEPESMPGDMSQLACYRAEIGNTILRVDPDDMIHIMDGVDPRNELKACSPLKSAMRLVLSDNEIAVYTWAILKRPHPSMIISPKQDVSIDDDALSDLLASIEEQTANEKSGGVMALNVPMDVNPTTISPEDMALDKIANLPEERITAIFGIASIVVGLGSGLQRSTFSNFKEARKAATEDFLVPHWRLIESAFDEQLVPEFESSSSYRIRFDLGEVKALQDDEDARQKRVRDNWNANLIDQATAQLLLGETPDPAGVGVYNWMLRPVGMAPQQDAGKAYADRIRKEVEASL